jgi:O-antigen/teichoic acid export membrane protein
LNTQKKSAIITNTGLLYFRTIISAVITLFSTRLIINGLGLEDYGIYSILFGVTILFGAIQHALSISTQKFITEAIVEINDYNRNRLFSICLLIHITLAILILLIALPTSNWVVNDLLNIPTNRIQSAIVVYNTSIYIIVITIMFLPFQSIFFAYERLNIYGVLGILESLGRLALAFSLTQFNDRLTSFIFGLFLISIFINLSYFLFALYSFDIKLILNISNKIVKKILIQFYWNFIGTISNVINNQGQNILLNVFFGPILNTSRAISVQVKNTTYLLGSNIQTAINAPIVKLIKANKIDDANKLIFLSSKIIFFLF